MKKLNVYKSLVFIVLLVCSPAILLAQSPLPSSVIFVEFPKDSSLVSRNLQTNTGKVLIAGTVDNGTNNYSAIEVEVFRESIIQTSMGSLQSLNFSSSGASFSFEISINAELANYSFKVYGLSGGDKDLLKEAFHVVAGDVYITYGQSNSAAVIRDDMSANSYLDGFIRSYSTGKLTGPDLPLDLAGKVIQPNTPSEVPDGAKKWPTAKEILVFLSLVVLGSGV